MIVLTSKALVEQIIQSRRGTALPVAFGGAVVSVGGEAWHA
jgi:hypothetical protein